MDGCSYVVTGGSQGIGRAVVERLTRVAHVVVLDVHDDLAWAPKQVELVHGDARDPEVAARAATPWRRPPDSWSGG